MTHHESFPGRPRGRRARPDNDVPEWAGYDAMPADEREFPDLSPVRGRDARARDGRTGQPAQGQPVQGQSVHGLPPWEDQSWTGPQAPPPQPPVQPVQPPVQQRPAQQGADWTGADADPMEAFSERWQRRGGDSRDERRADRRKQRRMLIAGGAALAVVIAVAVYYFTGSGSGQAVNPDLGSLITTFLPGEVQTVPDACAAVPNASLDQYLPGQLRIAAPPLNTGANSQCTWTLDKAPVYRVLEVDIQAFSPNALVTIGDGSATFAAMSAFANYETAKQTPGAKSGQPDATVTNLSGMPGGDDSVAFEATQVFKVSGATTDMATVVVRYRNVIVTVVLNGLDHANVGNYGPVSATALSSAAQTVAREVTGKLVH